MRKFWRFFLLAVTGLALMVFSPPIIGQAKEVQSIGLDVNSAVIKDSKGKVYAHDIQLPKGSYSVNYKWSIPNGTSVKAGDTMTFTLPSNVSVPETADFSISGALGTKVGTVHIEAGNPIGVITLNSYMQTMTNNRRGSLYINVNEKDLTPTQPTGPISMDKAASWVDPENPTVINWQLTVHPDGNSLNNPVIKDTFSRNQTYVAGSVKASDGNGQSYPVTATSSLLSNAMTFKLSGSYTSNISLTYQTKTKLPTGADTFNNKAVYNDDDGHQATANAVISREDNTTTEPENPGTEQPGQNEPVTMSKSVSWVDPHDQTKLNWSIKVNDQGNELVNPLIVDQLSPNQAFVPNSAKMVTGLGDKVPLALSVSGNKRVIVFKAMGTYSTSLHLTYQTSTTTTKGVENFSNNAAFSDDNNNKATATAEIDRTAEPEPTTEPITMKKSVAWADPADKTKLNWDLAVSANGNDLVNPTITDKLSSNQSFVAGSAHAVTAAGETVPLKATASGTEIVFQLTGTYQSNLRLTYQTTTDEVDTAATFDNVALYEDKNDNHASANASIDREAIEKPIFDPIAMQKTATWSDPTDKTKINWVLTVTSNGNRLTNPVVTDQLSDNQAYVLDSIQVSDTKGSLPVIATVNGAKVTFNITGETTDDLKLTYQTTTTAATGNETFDNAAVFDDQNNHHAEANTSIDREAPPVEPTKDPISLTKTAAWSDPSDHSKINWQLKVVANGNTLKNPVVTDILSNNQTYLADSAKAVNDTETTIPMVVTVNGNTLTFQFSGDLATDLILTYQTTTNDPTGAATFDNAAVVDDDNNNHAGGGSSIDRENPPVVPAKDPISMSKVAAWRDPQDHQQINWTLAIKANGNQLLNPVITDLLSDNQTYVAESAQALDESGKRLPLTVSVAGQTLTFKLAGDFATNITLSYQTKTNSATGAEVFDNAALYTDDNDNNASASTDIDRPDNEIDEPGEPENPRVTEPETPGEPEPGNPGTTEPGTPGITEPENPGITAPVKPGPTAPATPAPTTPGTTAPAKPGTTVSTSQKPLPTPYNPTPGRLPQTDEARNAKLDTVIGSLVLVLALGLGYLELRHRKI